MAQVQLITASDIAPYKSISANTDFIKKVDPFIIEAQQFDLKEILGNEFYYDLLEDFEASPKLVKYNDLFYGSSWTRAGHTYTHEGLVPVICYYSYARYILNSNVNATAFGTVKKKEEYSENVDDKTVIRLRDQANSGALVYLVDVIKFLDHNREDYPLWKNQCQKRSKGKVRIISADRHDDAKGDYRIRDRRDHGI